MDGSNTIFGALLIAVTSIPVFVIAAYVRRGHLHLINGLDAERVRNPDALAKRLSLLLVLIGLAMLAAALGLYWAGSHGTRGLVVVAALVLAVNALGVALIVTVARARRGYREPTGRR